MDTGINSDDVIILRTREIANVEVTNRKRGRPRTKLLQEEPTEPVTKYDEYVGMTLTFKINSKAYTRKMEKSNNKYYIKEIGKGKHILTDKEIDDAIKDTKWILMQLK